MTIPEIKPEHIWQDFRIRCLKLAIESGDPTWLELAEKAADALNDLYQAIGAEHLK